MIDIPLPREVGVPHDDWRKGQLDAFLSTREQWRNGGGHVFASLATGTGKTAIACALGSEAPILYVAGTLALLDQAEREYGFVAIKGRQEYPCALRSKCDDWSQFYNTMPTAADCHQSKMGQCPAAGDCAYLIQKVKAVSARLTACTYKYAMLSHHMQTRSGIVVLDECHASVKEILSFAEFKMDGRTRDKWRLPAFPYQQPYGNRGDVLSMEARDKVTEWITRCINSLMLRAGANSKEGAQAKRLYSRLSRLREELPLSNWFLECGRGVLKYGRSKDGIYLRALDARAIAPRLWANKRLTLLMSATIGKDAKAIAGQLNIGEHQFLDYPHPVPGEYRPVFDLGMDRMTKTNLNKHPGLYLKQARKIYDRIITFDADWRGLIVTSSNDKVDRLRGLLGLWLGERIFLPPVKAGPAQRAAAFITDPRPGLIAVDTIQGWGHGLDLRGDIARFVVIAGVPFENPSDPFVQARRKVVGADRYMWWKSYSAIPQAAGRVSRGERDENGNWLLNVAVLADGSATSPRAKKHFPEWFEVTR